MISDKNDLLTVREASVFLKINEKKLYALLRDGRVPGTKVTGKWLLPQNELERFVACKAGEALRGTFRNIVRGGQALLVCGSDDPVLSIAQGVFHRERPDLLLLSSSVGSREGLRLLRDGACTIALSHLFDETSGDFTFPFLREHFHDTDEVVVVNLFFRNIGFVTRSEGVSSLQDCVRRGMRLVNRQRGSGVRALLDRLMEKERLAPDDLPGYGNEVFTHVDVVRAVALGEADVGIASESACALSRLVFHRIFEERFDMVVMKESFFEPAVQAFIEFVRSAAFVSLLDTMRGYSSRCTGRIMYARSAS